MGRFSHTWRLMGASWNILRQDKEMLLFSVFSALSSAVVLASFALPLLASEALVRLSDNPSMVLVVLYALVAFAFYFCNYFVIVFFNAAIVACACKRMAGGDPTVGDGLRAAFNRIHLIATWAVLSATVGMLLRMIESRSNTFGRFVAGLLGMAWTAVTFLVVPILVIERIGPIDAVKESGRLLRETWGEQIVGHFSFGMVFGVLSIPLFLIAILGIAAGSAAAAGAAVLVAVAGFVLLAIVQSTLQTIFQAALYLYVRDGRVASGFDRGLLEGAMTQQ